MQAVEFPGCDRLVQRLDASVGLTCQTDVANSIKDSLIDVIAGRRIDLPPEVQVPGEASYGRHLLYSSDEHEYVVIAMAWGPGQGTPVHDHAGVWCVECVWKGELDVVQYDLKEEVEDRCRFERQDAVRACRGTAGALIPPFDYHTIANGIPEETSVTIHVYAKELDNFAIFHPLGGDWYRREVKSLSYKN
ncbi:MAG: cysteine dioxygenase family protein [Pseudomonadota bacterium]